MKFIGELIYFLFYMLFWKQPDSKQEFVYR